MGCVSILGPRGLPIVGSLLMLSRGLPHSTLASMAHSLAMVNANAKQLMAFSLGSTRALVTFDPQIVKEILTSTHFGDRPINQSAQELMFDRAMGLAPGDVQLSNGMVVPSSTTTMVNMCATIHDSNIWEDPLTFKPERFQDNDFDVRGTNLRLEPFGAGQRVCPSRNLGLAVVTLWVARLVQHFQWTEKKDDDPVNLEEVLKLSCEMKKPLCAVVVPTNTCSMFSP
ncbi:hypothetical protein Ancab_036202 [Ancistrocladus abbreviatus]